MNITFIKKDGSQRTLQCTLRPDVLPALTVTALTDNVTVRTDVIKVFCTDINEWRSFNYNSLISAESEN